MARVGSTNFKITKMAGCAEEISESDEEIQRILEEKDAQNTKNPPNLPFEPSQPSQSLKKPKKAWKISIKAWQGFLQMHAQKKTAANTKSVLV